MAPVDDKIAAARLEKQKSLKGSGTYGEVNAKVAQTGVEYADSPRGAIGGGSWDGTQAYRPPSAMEQLEKSANFHFEQHVRSQQGASFLKAHPEFEEFLRLFRTGVFPVIVLALCCVAAFAQSPTKPATPTTPALSTAEKTALTALEKQKQEAQQNFQQAQQAESVIEREFITAHAGYHVNPMTFVVEADAPIGHVDAPAPKPVLQRPAPPKK